MSAAVATFPATSSPLERPAVNPWLIAATVTLATFMELLDTAIANVALPHIAGGLPRRIHDERNRRNSNLASCSRCLLGIGDSSLTVSIS